ncbi:MAG: exodeoxyribonuclease V subunit gamma [Chlorobiaceae bacterium]|nr:exodeoxyribonuclease V subunit gamma [Chlorobiaceae bacterium]
MPLKLYTSNRMEALASAFADVVSKRPPGSPFSKEVVVVQSRGMQRWLSMRLASRFGVWANGYFPFPNTFVSELFGILGLAKADASSFSRESMRWSLMRLLPLMADGSGFEPVRSYLVDDPDGLKRLQLAGKIADAFDQYTIFRPELLEAWERGGDDGAGEWQPSLWRELVAQAKGRHRGSLKSEFCERLSCLARPEGLPERISLFGISYLPPFHLDMLSAIARSTEVDIFLLSPTREYWGDIVSRKTLSGMPAAERKLRTEGNPLLASLGRSGRDFSEMVLDMPEVSEGDVDLYVDPGDDTLLHALQGDMLNLAGTGGDEGYKPFDPADRSVQVHSCHSALREVEVLHDNLLDLLETVPGLVPREIVVMTPDIETYAPYITTVFGSRGDGVPRLPFSIADRRLLNEGNVASSLLKLLGLYGSRCTAPAMFDLLSSPPVRRRFGLEERELEVVRNWIGNIRIRWGIDEEDRKKLLLPSYRENSWRAGLDRLLLGYSMPDEGVLVDGVLPYDGVEGDPAVTLGKFAVFVDAVESFLTAFDKPAKPEEWGERLAAMLDGFIKADDESERELGKVHEAVDAFVEAVAGSGLDEDLSAQVMISWFRSRLEEDERGLGFMTGGITFCAMLPMRSIPFRVVAMIGMNDGSFPRQQQPPGFDLITRFPRRGDRSVRGDDRYLFLESILSARDVLYLSYIGQSVKDNSEIPPSVLVSELLDAVRRRFVVSGPEDPTACLLVRHRLQGFNPEYFTPGSKLFSYASENFDALSGNRSGQPRPPFIVNPLAQPSDELKLVSLDRLARFFANPSAFFLEERLGMRSGPGVAPLEDREPFEASGLDAYLMRQELLETMLAGVAPQGLLPLFRSRGLLPPALHGERIFGSLVEEVAKFVEEVRKHDAGGGSLEKVDLDLDIDGFRLTGSVESRPPGIQLFYRCAAMKENDRIRAWIAHLALSVSPGGSGSPETLLVMRDRSLRYRAVGDAAGLLGELLDAYRQGLSVPLPFFPKASTAWSEKLGKSDGERLSAAMKAWADGYDNRPGEGSDPAYRRCFGDGLPFGEEFRSTADRLLRPMIEHGGKP